MKNIFFVLVSFLICSSAFAKQTLQQAMDLNPRLAAVVAAVQAGAGVECLTKDTFQTSKIYGPESRVTTTHQSACFNPDVENPDQLGQLFVTFYGDGLNEDSQVGSVIDIQFTVFK